MPPLDETGLWRVQAEAIRKLEESFALNKPRALIQMATGSGKTFTAVNACYRLLRSSPSSQSRRRSAKKQSSKSLRSNSRR